MSQKTIRIALVEDDLELASLITKRLQNESFEVFHAGDGNKAPAMIAACEPDLVILDVMLPGMTGFEICRAIKPGFKGPVLFLTALDDDLDQLKGFDLGADDYVVKPVKPQVLIARIRALLRRGSALKKTHLEVFERGDLHIDCRNRSVLRGRTEIELTTAEFDVLCLLARHSGEILSREALYQMLYKTRYDGFDRAVDVYISRIRQKLGDDPEKTQYVKTVRGVGYLFAV